MTSKTGSTEMKYDSFRKPAPFSAAIFGACSQLGTLSYVWSTHSTAKDCMIAPLNCLLHPFQADAWGLTVVLVSCFSFIMWAISLHALAKTGTSDPSIVDRLWSIMPCVYIWFWFVVSLTSGLNVRLLLMTFLSTIWGSRLTYNFWKKGGYSGGEDYRWVLVRTWYPSWRWEIFNLVFVCYFQQFTILAFSVSAVAALQSTAPLNVLDALAFTTYALLLLGETIADQQMYSYQTEKYRRKAAGEALGPYSRGFIETGLWACSRHPNYFCEVSLWWAFYIFSVAATGTWLNWCIWGPLFLTGLFVPPGASLDVTELISSSKYPDYADYQRRVSRFVPWFPSVPPKKE